MKQANRQGRPWQRKDGRWADRAYPPGGGKPVMVYGRGEGEVVAKRHAIEYPVPRVRSDESIGRPEDIGTHPDAEVQAMATGQRPRPPKPVRFTLDLDPARHAFLKTFAVECGAGTGAAEVMRALLDELAEGSNLPARVKARIWAGKR